MRRTGELRYWRAGWGRAFGVLAAMALLASSGCLSYQVMVRSHDPHSQRRIDVLCRPAGAECQLRIDLVDGGRTTTLLRQFDDFTMGAVEVQWSRSNGDAHILICDGQGEHVLLRYRKQGGRAERVGSSKWIEEALLRRYAGTGIGEVVRRGARPIRWVCESTAAQAEFRRQLGTDVLPAIAKGDAKAPDRYGSGALAGGGYLASSR
jgi:hypothetical protein